ncbi:hypothetical protein [Shewanella glacialimarina]|uniref:hypothetical protein n=1 Tax=Shewanella glacialimarina TaxID=2590884 RepID=UPI001CF86708|nr:hypothetical protein [Shewanella glacialimarina]UCX05444.1 hypothetical protein FJ709_13690 [Shewanella glacialimarina]
MDKKTQGAWLIHHTSKLQGVENQTEFGEIYSAGKAGILLSAISADNQMQLTNERLKALANASNINALEFPAIKQLLKDKNIIDIGNTGIEVLGITSASVLTNTSNIFDSLDPSPIQYSYLNLAEKASCAPIKKSEAGEEISDTLKLSKEQLDQVFTRSEQVGFVDFEKLDQTDNLYFNGNIFRREYSRKISSVLSSLNGEENRKLIEVNQMLKMYGCISVDEAKRVLGVPLFSKISSIGLYDISVVSNDREEAGYLTMPSAFSKYSNSLVEDAFDLAKAFVSSITYGMTKSEHSRGKINHVSALIRTLVNGGSIGPVPAILHDYKVMEMKGVVQVYQGKKGSRIGPMMKLLKKEVGELALQVLTQGNVSEHSLICLPSAAVTNFTGPEVNRVKSRKTVGLSKRATIDMLSALRTGNL